MSIRARLTRLLLIAIVPMVLAIGAGLFVFVRVALAARFDDGLLARARAISGMVRNDGGKIELDFEGAAIFPYEQPGGGECFQIWTIENGSVAGDLARSASLGAERLAARLPSPGDTMTWDAPLPIGVSARYLSFRFRPLPDADSDSARVANQSAPDVPDVLLIVAQDRRELDRALAVFAASLIAAGVLLVGGVLLSVRRALARGLTPIDDLARQLESIGPSDLSLRVSDRESPGELAPIARRVNAMLDRVAAAFEREKRFAGVAAHELRTPVAEIRAVAELALSRERGAEEYRRALAAVLGASIRMGESADAVLRLARVQSGRERVDLQSVDAREVLGPAWDRWILPLASRGVRASLDIPPGISVRADRSMLAVALDNVCANAAAYSSSEGDVRAECRGDGPMVAVLTISNAPGAARDEQAHTHAGLGLLIAASMVGACGGAMETDMIDGRYVVSIRLSLDAPESIQDARRGSE